MEWLVAWLPWPAYRALDTLMSQGGMIMWVIFLVAMATLFLALQRWLTWRYLPSRRAPAPGEREALVIKAEYLRSLNRMERGLPLLKALVMITPLLGLTGTVTGMMLVFDGLSLGSSADPRQLASGIARAILPTFASMAVVLLGMFFLSLWQRQVRRTLQQNQ
ncbi:biopolymer transport protein ExbB [Marinospirillum celere]|uniref:Biopolymer transport protein ExbB n=1 Tax=Marinospirillum celere TaxID=1122252 RepID=A0A1I1J5E3_9GAMM|nr:MotA/TolQ/ExbB proton channel family protein [Marinospirillum celere]SFC41163.1 biopolymer transport protein ExbB [Marinospirillum celere]